MRIALIGNCQVQTMALLAGRMLDGAEIRVFDYSQAYSRDEATRARFADGLGDCDLILVHTAHLSHTGERDLRPRYGGRMLTVANFYFRGLFPDSCYIGDFAHRLDAPLTVHSVLVLDAFRRGLSEEEALLQFDIEAMARLGLLDAWDASMEEMRRREAHGTVDVPAAAMMEEACRTYPAFLTMNHPSVLLVADYLARVFDHAGLRQRPAAAHALPDPLAEHDTTPVLDEVAEYLGLPWRATQRWKLHSAGKRHIDRREFVAACYEAYRAEPAARLLVHSPTDLVAAFAADPAHEYLVRADAVPPAGARPPPPAGARAAGPSVPVTLIVREEVARAVRPLAVALADIRLHTHKAHSFLEVIDPKVERLAHRLDQVEAREAAAAAAAAAALAPVPPPPRQGLRRLLGRVARRLAGLVPGRLARGAGG